MIRLEHLSADVLELSKLARAALSGRLDSKLASVPRTVEGFARYEDHLEASERGQLARTLETQLAPLQPNVAVLDAVRALSSRGACAVVTGQQPGFTAAPLYSLYKALQAIRLAASLRQLWEVPVVALFWNHADDHDLAEVHHTYALNANLDLQKFALAGLASGRQPLSRIVLDDEAHRLGALRAALEQSVHGLPHAERAMSLFVPRSGETFARAFTRAFTELLGPLGLVVVEPDWIREPMSRELARLVGLDPLAPLQHGAAELRAAGYDVPIEPESAALVYAHEEKGRRALRVGGDGFRYDGEEGSRTCAELAAEILQAPLAWSPGALLRPLVQDRVLPVAAYVGGFGELAYHAELGPLRALAHVPQTPFVPRVSMTLVDGDTRFALRRLEAGVADVLRARGVFAPGGAQVEAPRVAADLRAAAARAKAEIVSHKQALGELDAGLAVQLKRTGDQVVELVEKLAEKAERVQQNKSGKGRRHERRVNNALFPRGLPQERVLGPLPFVARFGEEWVQELANEIDPLCGEHVVVHLGGEVTDDGKSDA